MFRGGHDSGRERQGSGELITTIANMRLIEAGGSKILAGHDVNADGFVFVLRRDAKGYTLHRVQVGDREQLRAFLSASQSEANELVAAILETVKKKPKRRAKRKATKPSQA